MSAIDYTIDILLIAVVLRQMQARELTPGSAALPLILVGVACLKYLRPFTPHGNDVLLIAVLAAAGAASGLLSGVVTTVWRNSEDRVLARAGVLAAAFWIAGMGARFAFAVWSTGPGGVAVGQFSAEHDISAQRGWTAALLAMAVGEVLARVAVLQLRRTQARHDRRPSSRMSGPWIDDHTASRSSTALSAPFPDARER